MTHQRIAFVVLLVVSSLGIQAAFASECIISGARYELSSDTVDWSMKIGSGQSCIRGLRFNNIVIDTVKVISSPRSGQVTLLGPAFSYGAKSDFQGEDSFNVVVSGTIHGSRGSSTIRIVVTVESDQRRKTSATHASGSTAGIISGDFRDDGFANAPICSPQFTSLLDEYHADGETNGRSPSNGYQPPWHVAGVDYCVGYPVGTRLKDPETIATDSSAPYYRDEANHFIIINADNAVLDGWNFALEGGWSVRALNANNPTIKNSYFQVGANGNVPIFLMGWANGYTGNGATIINNVVDGSSINIGGLGNVMVSRGGNIVIQYNLIENAGADLINAGADTVASGIATNYDIKYNVLYNAGQADGQGGSSLHPDWFQTYASGNYSSVNIDYNTIVQTQFPYAGGGSQGFTLDGNTNAPLATFGGGTASNNTIIVTSTPAGAQGFVFRVDRDILNGTFAFNNNFVDPRGLSAPTGSYVIRSSAGGGPYNGTIRSSGNANMVTGTQPSSWNISQ
jgi:hypothetical protein